MIHLRSAKTRGGFQIFFTVFKLVLIAGLIGCGLVLAAPQPVTWWPTANDLWSLSSAPFAVSLVYVTYSYSGWNASVYLASEVREPERNIPRSLLAGTLAVIVLYLLLNFVFLYSTPASVLTGQLQVGFLAAERIFGPSGARVAGLLISFGLVSAVSSMTWAGPRVVSAVGEDVRFLRPFAALNGHGVPQRALFLQTLIVITLILTSTFEQVITYLGFTLAASTFLAVAGVFVIRRRLPDADRPFKAWGYPVTPLFFLAVTGWMLVYLLYFRPFESLAGLATLILGLVVYFAAVRVPQPASPFGPSEARSGLLDQDAGQ
jgi:APA family basic amino acid/polyamine antiporter